jgi:hypothetical protein
VVTRDERLAMIDRLQREADAGRERIAENRRRIEDLAERGRDDPRAAIALDDLLRAEREAERSPHVQRNDDAGGLIYRTMQTQPTHAAEPAPDYSDWERWLRAHLDIERREVREALQESIAVSMGEVIGKTVGNLHREHDAALKRIAELEAENAVLRGKLDDVLKKFESVAAEVDAGNRDRDALVASFQVEVAELRGRLSAVLRDYYA